MHIRIYEFYKIYRPEFDKVISCVRNTIYQEQNSKLKEESDKDKFNIEELYQVIK